MFASDSWAPVTCSRVSDPVDPRLKPRGNLQASAGAGGRNHAQETGLPHRSGPASCQAIGGQTMTLLFRKQHAQDRIEWPGIRSIGGGRPRRRGLLPREWMDPSASPRGVGLGMASGVLGLPVRGPRETPSVRPELSNCLICRRLVRPAPQSQPACCNAQTAANNAFAFRLRCKVPRRGDTPQPGRGNVLLDKMHST
jgi:hypothetical protein